MRDTPTHYRAMAWWLYGCCGMVFGMVALGGITRLTGSGLSMVEWKPTGIMPPTTAEAWEEEFRKYKQFPEYQKHNNDLSMSDFQWIWFMEWGHRMAGRATGMVFGLPLLYFGFKGAIPRKLVPRMLGLLALGGSQGLIGWWMVRSGLDDNERFGGEGRVSPYRLAAHLSMAFVLYTVLFNTALGLHTTQRLMEMVPSAKLHRQNLLNRIPTSFRIASVGLASLVGLTAFSGAFVAGNHAGMIYDEFPTMGGKFVPEDLLNPYLEPKWRNLFEHDTMVQWNHRVLAMATLGGVTSTYFWSRLLVLPPNARMASHLMMAMSTVQVSLGISTLLLHVPVPLASAHQMGSLTLLTLSLWFAHTLRSTLPLAATATMAPGTTVAAAAAAALTVAPEMPKLLRAIGSDVVEEGEDEMESID